MLFWFLNRFKKLVGILNGNISPNQIAAGFAWGILIGLLPFIVLVTPLLFLVFFIFQLNLAMGLWAMVLAQILAYLIDPIANRLGYYLLVDVPALTPLWTYLYNAPLWPYTQFNNTLVLGSFVAGIALLVPVFFLFRIFVIRWRSHIKNRIENTMFMRAIKKSKPVELWIRFRDGINL